MWYMIYDFGFLVKMLAKTKCILLVFLTRLSYDIANKLFCPNIAHATRNKTIYCQ